MNRRDFFAKLLIAQAAFLILPAAKTYRRTWKELLCPKKIVTPSEYPDVFDAFRIACENLDRHIYQQATKSSVWLNLLQGGMYPLNAGGAERPIDNGAGWTKLILPI